MRKLQNYNREKIPPTSARLASSPFAPQAEWPGIGEVPPVTGGLIPSCNCSGSETPRSCLICSSCSGLITNCWLSWTAGLSLSQPNIRAAEAARSRRSAAGFRTSKGGCVIAVVQLLPPWRGARARAVLVVVSSGLLLSQPVHPQSDSNWMRLVFGMVCLLDV